MVIYGEYLFLENLISGVLLLLLTGKLLGERIRNCLLYTSWILEYLIQQRLMSILNEQKNNGDKPLSIRSLKRKQRTGRKTMNLLLQMSLCNYLLNSDR